MKKIIRFIIIVSVVFSLVGCGNSLSSSSGTKKTNEKQNEFLKGI